MRSAPSPAKAPPALPPAPYPTTGANSTGQSTRPRPRLLAPSPHERGHGWTPLTSPQNCGGRALSHVPLQLSCAPTSAAPSWCPCASLPKAGPRSSNNSVPGPCSCSSPGYCSTAARTVARRVGRRFCNVPPTSKRVHGKIFTAPSLQLPPGRRPRLLSTHKPAVMPKPVRKCAKATYPAPGILSPTQRWRRALPPRWPPLGIPIAAPLNSDDQSRTT